MQEVRKGEAPEYRVVDAHSPGIGSGGEIPFERARSRLQARQQVNRRGRGFARLNECRCLERAFAEGAALEEPWETEPARGFYNHFDSKDELYAEAVRSFITCNPFDLGQASSSAEPTPRELAGILVNLYLSDTTLADVDQQCPLIALPSDVARAGLEPRAAYTALVESLAEVFRAAFLPDDTDAARKALLMVSLCVGGLVIARTSDDPRLRQALRTAAREEALGLLDR